eukprot:365948-Chlamydomonas_euryale.AAC.9
MGLQACLLQKAPHPCMLHARAPTPVRAMRNATTPHAPARVPMRTPVRRPNERNLGTPMRAHCMGHTCMVLHSLVALLAGPMRSAVCLWRPHEDRGGPGGGGAAMAWRYTTYSKKCQSIACNSPLHLMERLGGDAEVVVFLYMHMLARLGRGAEMVVSMHARCSL